MPARRLLMRKIREVLRLKHEQGLSHQAVAQACAVGVGTVNRYLQRAAQRGLVWPLPAELDDATLEARLFPRAAPVHDRGSGPTARISTASSSATASRCSCCGRSTPRSIRTATAVATSARSTGNGRGGCGRRCGRCTGPARRRSLTSPASGRRWSTGARVNRDPWSCSSPCSAPAASPTSRRPRPSSCRTGSTCTSAWWSTSAVPPRCGSPISSRAPSPAPAATSPASTAPTRTWPPTTAPSSSRRGRGNLGIRLLWRIVCSWPSAGYWPVSATRPSSSSAR